MMRFHGIFAAMTKVMNLGAFDAPLLVCGGAYGNLEALEALFAAANLHGIPAQRMLHTGDAVAYCADGAAVVTRLRASGVHCLMGNVEQQLAADAEDCGCGFEEGTSCDALSGAWYAHARRTLPADAKTWMGSLPEHMTFEMAGRRFLVVHGGVSAINRFLFASQPEADFEAELALGDCDGVIGGHCGLPFTRLAGGRLWHNSGALGLPANDGSARVWYSVLRPEGKDVRISHHSLGYAHHKAADKMRAAGLPEGYAAALGSGRWPSLDVLPATERAGTGKALVEAAYVWRGAAGGAELSKSEEKHVRT